MKYILNPYLLHTIILTLIHFVHENIRWSSSKLCWKESVVCMHNYPPLAKSTSLHLACPNYFHPARTWSQIEPMTWSDGNAFHVWIFGRMILIGWKFCHVCASRNCYGNANSVRPGEKMLCCPHAQWRHQMPPPSEALSPRLPPCQKGKMVKISHFRQIYVVFHPQKYI